MNTSYGFIETKGYIAAIEAADAMVKSAKVRLINLRRIGSALVTVIVEGPLDACQAAIQAGSAAAERLGELVSAHVIARPDDDLILFTGSASLPKIPKPGPKPGRSRKPINTIPKTAESIKENVLLQQLSKASEGLTLNDLVNKTGQQKQQLRRQLKQLMDNDSIEKIQQKYFILHKGKKK